MCLRNDRDKMKAPARPVFTRGVNGIWKGDIVEGGRTESSQQAAQERYIRHGCNRP